MGRLRSFPDYRIVGRRDTMIAYDCDDEGQFEELTAAVNELSLDQRNLLQAFAPDTLAEARNRRFRPARGADTSSALGSSVNL